MMTPNDLPRVMDRAEIEAAITHQLRPSDQEAMRRMFDGLYADDPVEDEPEPTVRRAMDTILAALESVDEKTRQANFTYVLETLHNEAAYIPLTYERNRVIHSSKVKKLAFNPSQFEIPVQRMRVE